jgi:hypothetical protein
MGNYLVTDDELASVSSKIRSKTGASDALVFPTGFISEVDKLTDTRSANATAGDIRSGKTAFVNGNKVTGNLAAIVRVNNANVMRPTEYNVGTTTIQISSYVRKEIEIPIATDGGHNPGYPIPLPGEDASNVNIPCYAELRRGSDLVATFLPVIYKYTTKKWYVVYSAYSASPTSITYDQIWVSTLTCTPVY